MDGLCGVFTNLELAKEAAQEAKDNEPDNYHGFEILRLKMNTLDIWEDENVTVYSINGEVAKWPGTN